MDVYIDMEILDGKAHQATGLPTFSNTFFRQNGNRNGEIICNLLQCLQRVKQKCGGTDTVRDGLLVRLVQSTEGAELGQHRHLTVSGSWPVVISLTVEAGAGGSGESCLQDKAPDLESALTCFTHKFELYDLGHLW